MCLPEFGIGFSHCLVSAFFRDWQTDELDAIVGISMDADYKASNGVVRTLSRPLVRLFAARSTWPSLQMTWARAVTLMQR